jgi:hypothetical protein
MKTGPLSPSDLQQNVHIDAATVTAAASIQVPEHTEFTPLQTLYTASATRSSTNELLHDAKRLGSTGTAHSGTDRSQTSSHSNATILIDKLLYDKYNRM